MALIKCLECNNEISDKAITCPHCGCPVLTKNTTQSSDVVLEESENIPTPKLSTIVVLGIASMFALIAIVFAIQTSFISFLLTTVMFMLVLGACITSIKDYNLAKKDFSQYKNKIQLEKEATKAMQEAKKERKELEEKKQAELNIKRAELAAKGIATCPKCGSSSIATINRGYSMIYGFIGSGRPINVCQVCGHKWPIGK